MTSWMQWIGIAGAIFAAGGTWHVQGERVDILYQHHVDHETRIRAQESNRRLEDMVGELKILTAKQTTKIESLEERIKELSAVKRRK